MGTVQFSYLTEQQKNEVEKIIRLTIDKIVAGSEYEITYTEYEEPTELAIDYVPPFEAGTCLSTKLYPGGYGTAIVLNTQEGLTLLGGLSGVHKSLPSIELCKKKNWLFLTHHNFENEVNRIWCDDQDFRENADWFEVIGNVILTSDDPVSDIKSGDIGFGSCLMIENQTWLQDKWDRGER